LGLLNAAAGLSAAVDVTLYDEAGAVAGSIPSYPLEPGQYVQFNLFQTLSLAGVTMNGSIECAVTSGGPVAAYASVVDNRTQDPVFVPAQVR